MLVVRQAHEGGRGALADRRIEDEQYPKEQVGDLGLTEQRRKAQEASALPIRRAAEPNKGTKQENHQQAEERLDDDASELVHEPEPLAGGTLNR